MQRGANQDGIFALPAPAAQMHEAKGAKQEEQAAGPGLGCHAAAKQRAGTARSESEQGSIALPPSNVSLQMGVTDHKPFPSGVLWSHPEPSPCARLVQSDSTSAK